MEGKQQPVPGGPQTAREFPAEVQATVELVIDETRYATALTTKFLRRKPWQPRDPHLISAAIPGLILSVSVKIGDRVRRGHPLLSLEAMKMQNQVVSPADGVVAAVRVVAGQKVVKGELMIELRD